MKDDFRIIDKTAARVIIVVFVYLNFISYVSSIKKSVVHLYVF